MKTSTYDTLSMLAIVALVACTFLAQHSSLGYVFGVLAVLTAVGLLAAYIKALPTLPQTADQTTEAIERKQESDQREALLQNIYRASKREWAAQLQEARWLEHLREHRFRVSVKPVEYRLADLKAGSYYAQVKYYRDPVDDPASIITDIVEKLCASSKEPRFEFILGPDGSFKIQQVPVKRSAIEPIAAQEESVEPFEMADDKHVVN